LNEKTEIFYSTKINKQALPSIKLKRAGRKNMKKREVVFLKGKRIILRPINKETDLEKCVIWTNDPEVTNFLSLVYPVDKIAEGEWFDKLSKDKNNVILAIETLDGKFIGTMGLHGINWINRTATTGALIGEKKYWGKGYGTEAKMLVLNYAFNQLNLRRIKSEVIAYNKRSLNYSLHCGYEIEGRKKQEIYKNGRYWDLIQLGLFKNKWLKVWKKYQKTNGTK